MSYLILPQSLHGTADLAVRFLKEQWGIPAKCIQKEVVIDQRLNYRPTICAKTSDFHTLCVDVSESAYNNSLDKFVQECVDINFPAKLYVALPKDVSDSEYSQKIKRAKKNGVGIIELDATDGVLVQDAISLSLAKVRPIPLKDFPPKYRAALANAENTFRSANPDKGCALVFDEMEHLFRRLSQELNEKKLWQSKKRIQFAYDTGNWASLIELVQHHIDLKRCKCPNLKPAFIARIHGFTQYRNESGHKPKNQSARITRDTQLRTRFESASDTLLDLVNFTKPMKL